MNFKSYCWSIGTTSFRTSQLNYKIERQLQLLKQFRIIVFPNGWGKKVQKDYYYFLKKNDFVVGNALRPDKDARQKTSGLVELGLIDDSRQLTSVGKKIEGLLNSKIQKNNYFLIDEDSYYYLLQFLKMEISDKEIQLKPFISLIYMIIKLGYLSYDEFTYLLPLCKNKYEVIKMVELIKGNRLGINVDEILITKIFGMSNYIKAWEFFRKEYPVTELTFEVIGLNRKSRKYDRNYNYIYHLLVELVFSLKKTKFNQRLEKYKALYRACSKISGKAQGLWKDYLFMGYNLNNIDEEYDLRFKELDISKQFNIIDFKRVFFEKIHIFKWKVNLKEYFDLNKRYFSLTDILKFERERVELDLLPKYYFFLIIDDLLNEDLIEPKKYRERFYSLIPIETISNKYNIDIEMVIEAINNDLGTTLTINNLSNYIENKKLKEFKNLINEKFSVSNIIKILDNIKNRRDDKIYEMVTDNATISTIFEYIVGIAWYKVSNEKGNILKYMNLSLDANLLPKTHACGGVADIVYKYKEDKYPNHNLLIEVTLSISTNQRSMEMEPVSRHLGEKIKESRNKKDYAIFIANILDERLILDFRNRKTYFYPLGNNKYINGLKIIPMDIEILKQILAKGIKYYQIYNWFEDSYKSEILDIKWYEIEIQQKIDNW